MGMDRRRLGGAVMTDQVPFSGHRAHAREEADRSKPAGAICGECDRPLWGASDHAPGCQSNSQPETMAATTDSPTPDAIRQTAKTICANAWDGFCSNVGGDLGCKAGRGTAPTAGACVATDDQLLLAGYSNTARVILHDASAGITMGATLIGHFRHGGWQGWQEVIPEAAGGEGVFAFYVAGKDAAAAVASKAESLIAQEVADKALGGG